MQFRPEIRIKVTIFSDNTVLINEFLVMSCEIVNAPSCLMKNSENSTKNYKNIKN